MTTDTDSELEQARAAVLKRMASGAMSLPPPHLAKEWTADDAAALRRFERAVRRNELKEALLCDPHAERQYGVRRWCEVRLRELEGQR